MSEDKSKENASGGKKPEGSRLWQRRRHRKNAPSAGLAKKNPEDIPLLHFGNNNNFHTSFVRDCRRQAALREYGHLGKLIELEEYYSPTLPTRMSLGLTDTKENTLLYHEAVRAHLKMQTKMVLNQPKLYGLIQQYLSPESMDEVKHHNSYLMFNDAKDLEVIWKAVVETHKVHSLSKVAAVKKRSARVEYQKIRQGGYDSAALKAYMDQGNPALDDTDKAMNFFDGLDNGCYAHSRLISIMP
jgi:hypothetical protein